MTSGKRDSSTWSKTLLFISLFTVPCFLAVPPLGLEAEILLVVSDTKDVEDSIWAAEQELCEATSEADTDYWKTKTRLLRTKGEQLRAEEQHLRDELKRDAEQQQGKSCFSPMQTPLHLLLPRPLQACDFEWSCPPDNDQ